MARRSKHRRTIDLASGRRLKLGQYVLAWKCVKQALAEGTPTLPCDLEHSWDHNNRQPTDAVLAQFRRAMHDRINRRGEGASGKRRRASRP